MIKEIIKDLKRQVNDIKEYDGEMESASWGYQYGVLLSGNEAQEIINILESKRE